MKLNKNSPKYIKNIQMKKIIFSCYLIYIVLNKLKILNNFQKRNFFIYRFYVYFLTIQIKLKRLFGPYTHFLKLYLQG